MGEVNSSALERYWSTRAFSITDVMTWDGREVSSGAAGYAAYEGAAWALVHWMSKERPGALDQFRAALRRGAASDVAWSDAFPDVPLVDLDATVRAYLRAPDRRLWWVEIGAISRSPPVVRPVSAAALAQLRAELADAAPDSVATVR